MAELERRSGLVQSLCGESSGYRTARKKAIESLRGWSGNAAQRKFIGSWTHEGNQYLVSEPIRERDAKIDPVLEYLLPDEIRGQVDAWREAAGSIISETEAELADGCYWLLNWRKLHLPLVGKIFACRAAEMLQAAEALVHWLQAAESEVEAQDGGGTTIEYPYDLTVDVTKKTVWRSGYSKQIDLSRSSVEWHILMTALKAAPGQATVDALQKDYPGEWEARGPAVNNLNKRLAPLGVKVENRTLKVLD